MGWVVRFCQQLSPDSRALTMRSISHLPRSLLPHSHLPTHPSFPRLALHSRFASTSTSTPPPTSTSTPPRPRIEATTFDGKSSPREVHERPERIRGMPPKGLGPAWQKAGAAAATTARPSGQKGEEEDFAGPSRPRMYYDRPGERDLPKLNVSSLDHLNWSRVSRARRGESAADSLLEPSTIV
jgi:hypothetical protein